MTEGTQHSELVGDGDEPPEPDRSGAGVTIIIDDGIEDVDVDWLADHVRQAIALLDRKVVAISIRVMQDAEMAAMHERFGDASETTDVLTFSYGEDAVEADIGVSIDVARRAAKEQGHNSTAELLLYIVHGVLHCMGYDDHEPGAWAAMHAEENRILSAMGVGELFGEVKR
ncbi:MAG: rRNA maturation RNase YbeY [Phycisphaerales bacterium]|nr:rRNA maturation RNase YbeY [Phycisphaerales bacterium]